MVFFLPLSFFLIISTINRVVRKNYNNYGLPQEYVSFFVIYIIFFFLRTSSGVLDFDTPEEVLGTGGFSVGSRLH